MYRRCSRVGFTRSHRRRGAVCAARCQCHWRRNVSESTFNVTDTSVTRLLPTCRRPRCVLRFEDDLPGSTTADLGLDSIARCDPDGAHRHPGAPLRRQRHAGDARVRHLCLWYRANPRRLWPSASSLGPIAVGQGPRGQAVPSLASTWIGQGHDRAMGLGTQHVFAGRPRLAGPSVACGSLRMTDGGGTLVP